MTVRTAFIKWAILGAVVSGLLIGAQSAAVGGIEGLLQVGETSSLRPIIQEQLGSVPLAPGPGHDGQIYYAIGLDLDGNEVGPLLDHAAYRYRRILYPLVSSGFGLLDGGGLLIGMIAVTVLSTGLAAGAVAQTYAGDLTLDIEVERIAKGLRRDFGGVDVLVHAAAVISLGRLEDASPQDLDRQFAINVRAPYALTRALLPMLRAQRGQVVFINSWAGLNARAGAGQYAATKHALKAIADSFREEVNPEGLRVLSVFPGRTATPMQKAIHAIEGKDYHPERLQQPADVAAVIIHALSLPRATEVTEIRMRPLIKS